MAAMMQAKEEGKNMKVIVEMKHVDEGFNARIVASHGKLYVQAFTDLGEWNGISEFNQGIEGFKAAYKELLDTQAEYVLNVIDNTELFLNEHEFSLKLLPESKK